MFNEKLIISSDKKIYFRSNNNVIIPEYHAPNHKKHNLRYNSKLLHPEDKLTNKPIIGWIDEINAALSSFKSIDYIIEFIDLLATITNQATFVMSCLNKNKDAYNYCNYLIFLFDKIYNKTNYKNILFYTIQPWINLARIDRIEGRYKAAIVRLKYLIKHNNKESSVISNILSKSLKLDRSYELNQIIDNAYIIDSLRTIIKCNNYKSINNLKKYNNINIFHSSAIAEAEIIGYFHTDQFNKAYDLAVNNYHSGIAISMPVFLYRLIEILTISSIECNSIIEIMIKYMKRKLLQDKNTIYDLVFMFEAYKYIYSNVEHFDFNDLALNFYHAFTQFDDEVYKVKSLELLSRLNDNYTETLKYLINKSYYKSINRENFKAEINIPYLKMLSNIDSISAILDTVSKK